MTAYKRPLGPFAALQPLPEAELQFRIARYATVAPALRFYETGRHEVLPWKEVHVSQPGPREARVWQRTTGLNHVDDYVLPACTRHPCRAILALKLPRHRREGQSRRDRSETRRLCRLFRQLPGTYSEERVMSGNRVVVLPDGISDQQAAAMMLKRLTVQYLLRQIYRVKEGDAILFHATAGGVELNAPSLSV